jgi:hypothetical protein
MRFALQRQADALHAGRNEADNYSKLQQISLLFARYSHPTNAVESASRLTAMLAPADSSTMVPGRVVAAVS